MSGDEISFYLRQYRQSKSEDAYFALIHLDEAQLPDLMVAYHHEVDVDIRALLVEVVSHYKQPNTLDFLRTALQNAHPSIWKNALDGIVSIGGQRGIEILEEEKQRQLADKASADRIEWIEEAIQQIHENR
jgi:hypothetical protein